MTKQHQIYKCNVCGNIVEVLHTGAGQLVCCGQPMVTFEEKNKNEGLEKHMPVIEALPGVCAGSSAAKVRVGETVHPMEEEHYIEWIEVTSASGKRSKKFLKPGDKPEATFCSGKKIVGARAYCNIHGLWKNSEPSNGG